MRFAVSLIAVALTGCGGWHRPNTSEAEFYRDRHECTVEARTAYPPQIVTQGGYTSPSQTRCTTGPFGSMNCSTTPGVTTGQVTTDQNAIAREMAFNSCMRARGYTFKVG